jgi:hypothetical protein
MNAARSIYGLSTGISLQQDGAQHVMRWAYAAGRKFDDNAVVELHVYLAMKPN